MEWTIDYLKEDGVASIKTSGVITWDQLWEASKEVLHFGREHNTHKFLADHRELKPGHTLASDELDAHIEAVVVLDRATDPLRRKDAFYVPTRKRFQLVGTCSLGQPLLAHVQFSLKPTRNNPNAEQDHQDCYWDEDQGYGQISSRVVSPGPASYRSIGEDDS